MIDVQHPEPAKPEEPKNLVSGSQPDQEPGGDRGGGRDVGAAVDLVQQDQQPAAHHQAGEAPHSLYGAQSGQVSFR